MKKALLIISLCSSSILVADELSDAIRASDLNKVKKIVEGSADIQDKHIRIARERMDLREKQLTFNSSITQEIPSGKWNKIGLAIGALGTIVTSHWIDDFYLFNSRFSAEHYYHELKMYRLLKLGFQSTFLANLIMLYKKKIKYLEDSYENASKIYEFLLDRGK